MRAWSNSTFFGCVAPTPSFEGQPISTLNNRGPILWRSSLRNTIYDVLKAREGWQEIESDTDWDFFWADKGCVVP